MGEHDAARVGLDRELQELVAVGVAAQLEPLDPGLDLGLDVDRLENEGVTCLGREQGATRCIRIAITDKADGVARVAEQAAGERVARGVFHEHAGTDDVEPVLLGIFAGVEFARRRLELQLLEDGAVEIDVFGLAGDLVKILRQIHAQAGGENGAVDQFAELAGIVHDREHFLHAPEREDRDEVGPAALDRVVDAGDQASELRGATLVDRPLGRAAGRLHDDRVEVPGRELCARQRSLILEEHVAGDEDGAMLVVKLDRRGADHVAGRMKDDLDLFLARLEPLGLTKRDRSKPFRQPVDLLVGEERVVRDVFLFLLPEHDAG